MAGLYIHIPFCKSKCPYCDFYSLTDSSLYDRYTAAICDRIARQERVFDTLYIGGGTPSVLGGERLRSIVKSARLKPDAEVTVECNPSSADERLFGLLSQAGVNRISMGMQSAVEKERKSLGRQSSAAQVKEAFKACERQGIDNISLDLMLGIPGQTEVSLRESLDYCLSLGVKHLSAYMLKLEEGTFFYKKRDSLSLPDEDSVCELYLQTVRTLSENGLAQYEISNFARKGREGKHNLNYWDGGEYLGLGPSAHSFLNGKRFYYTRSIEDFLHGAPPVPDGEGGDFEEYVMLRLRLREGLRDEQVRRRFSREIPPEYRKKAEFFAAKGYMELFADGFALNENGFLISNYIIGEFLA